jgi:hypothetical protein
MCKLGFPLFCGHSTAEQVNPASTQRTAGRSLSFDSNNSMEMLGGIPVPLDTSRNRFAAVCRVLRDMTSSTGPSGR